MSLCIFITLEKNLYLITYLNGDHTVFVHELFCVYTTFRLVADIDHDKILGDLHYSTFYNITNLRLLEAVLEKLCKFIGAGTFVLVVHILETPYRRIVFPVLPCFISHQFLPPGYSSTEFCYASNYFEKVQSFLSSDSSPIRS